MRRSLIASLVVDAGRARGPGHRCTSLASAGTVTDPGRGTRLRHVRARSRRRPRARSHTGRRRREQDREDGREGRTGPHLARPRRRRRRLLHEGLQAPRRGRAHRGLDGDGRPGGSTASKSSNLNFQGGDCRNGDRTTVTDAQVEYFIDQFDNNIYPTESELFSVPPDRDGVDSAGAARHSVCDPDYYAGDGDDIVVLIDNVRDDNFYDLNNTQGFSYIAGFFSSGLNGFFNRNVMTIDGFDWLHRTGDEPAERAGARRQLRERAGASEPLRGRLRARVPAPAALVRGPARGHLDQRGNVGHGDRADRLRRPRRADHRPRTSTPTSSASSGTTRSRPTRTRTRGRVVRRTR